MEETLCAVEAMSCFDAFVPTTAALVGIAAPSTCTTVAAKVPEVVTSPLRLPLVTVVAPENSARFPLAGLPVVVTVVPVISNFTLFEEGFEGVTVSPAALTVLAMKLIPFCEVMLDPIVENGSVREPPRERLCPLSVTEEFVRPALPSVPLNPACTTPVPVFVKVKVRPLNAVE